MFFSDDIFLMVILIKGFKWLKNVWVKFCIEEMRIRIFSLLVMEDIEENFLEKVDERFFFMVVGIFVSLFSSVELCKILMIWLSKWIFL